MNRKYLTLVLMAFVPALSGCLLQSLHAKGEVDINEAPASKEQSKEETYNEEAKL